MNSSDEQGLSEEEMAAQGATMLPDKEVVSILDLNADINLAIDAAAPIDLAVAANANVAAPIDAAVGANILSADSSAQALSDQGVMITQGIDADASAAADQGSVIDQAAGGTTAPADVAAPTDPTGAPADALGGVTDAVPAGATGAATDGLGGVVDGAAGGLSAGALSGNLLNVDVNVDADAGISAPINGAVAANANVAAPIDAAVAANVGSDGSDAVAVSQQDAIINQQITGSADATSDQSSEIQQ